MAEYLGMPPDAVRKNKQRGHERLREEVRKAVKELDLVLPPRLEEAIFPTQEMPGDEEHWDLLLPVEAAPTPF